MSNMAPVYKERGGIWAKQIYTMHSSTVKHTKHPYKDTKSNQCSTKKNLNTNVSSTVEGWRGGERGMLEGTLRESVLIYNIHRL